MSRQNRPEPRFPNWPWPVDWVPTKPTVDAVKAKLAEERVRALHHALHSSWASNHALHTRIDQLTELLARIEKAFVIGDGGGVFLTGDYKTTIKLMNTLSETVKNAKNV